MDPDDDELTFQIVSDPSHGTLTDFDADAGTVVYTPNPDYYGSDSFTFTVNDGTADSNVATVDVIVDAVIDIVADSAETPEDIAKTIAVLANDTFEGSPSVTAVTQGMHGTVVINPDDTVTYTPAADWNGTDGFTYTVISGGMAETATVTVTVLSAQEQIATIAQRVWAWVDSGLISRGQGNALQATLDGAIAQLNDGKTTPAVNKLEAFENQLGALVRSGQIPAEAGNAVIAATEDAIQSALVRATKSTDAVFAKLGEIKGTGHLLDGPLP
jgi:hypothetical protein